MLVHFLLGTVLSASLAFAEPNEDQKTLEGEWTVVRIERAGQSPPEEKLETFKVKIKDGKLTVEGSNQAEPATFSIDAATSPKHIDLTFRKAGDDASRKSLGIYQLEGDELKIAWRNNGPRPTEFKSDPTVADSGLFVLKRKKAE